MPVSIPKDAVPIVRESLKREVGLLESKIKLVRSEIKDFEEKYKMPSDVFLEQFEEGRMGDSQDSFEWWGLLKGLKKLEEKVKLTKAVLSSW